MALQERSSDISVRSDLAQTTPSIPVQNLLRKLDLAGKTVFIILSEKPGDLQCYSNSRSPFLPNLKRVAAEKLKSAGNPPPTPAVNSALPAVDPPIAKADTPTPDLDSPTPTPTPTSNPPTPKSSPSTPGIYPPAVASFSAFRYLITQKIGTSGPRSPPPPPPPTDTAAYLTYKRNYIFQMLRLTIAGVEIKLLRDTEGYFLCPHCGDAKRTGQTLKNHYMSKCAEAYEQALRDANVTIPAPTSINLRRRVKPKATPECSQMSHIAFPLKPTDASNKPPKASKPRSEVRKRKHTTVDENEDVQSGVLAVQNSPLNPKRMRYEKGRGVESSWMGPVPELPLKPLPRGPTSTEDL
ncbi:hypothetical protein DFH06DRAFT_1174213 [Mycena polygramma]|nr:hypothetical protein DFH06DRAFT_1174213 [Mycena polygramma]